MTGILSANITSPLGLTVQENFLSIKKGLSAFGRRCDIEPLSGLTRFQKLVTSSVVEALSHTKTDISSNRTVFILSTTKADVEELAAEETKDGAYLTPGESAKKIAGIIGFTTDPIVVCNACISGVSAQILADRLISQGIFDTAVVTGADCLTEFTSAGFTSFKALSPDPCRPFDISRTGLNLGEAAATLVLGRVDGKDDCWKIAGESLNNDAYHVSAPDPKGEGVLRAIKEALGTHSPQELATVTAHGTATMFNDQMESRAIERAALSDVPVTAYKGIFGHTLGASGILESIITMCSLDQGILLPVRGFEEMGVSGRISVCTKETATDKKSFLKIISGFGGCNGAVLYTREKTEPAKENRTRTLQEIMSVLITPSSLQTGCTDIATTESGSALLTEIYRSRLDDNPKFFKMDQLSRLAYLAAGILVKETSEQPDPERTGILLFNRSSSVMADRKHLGTFTGADGYYPSPSVFLYTLPNVVMGELAIKYGIKGETTLIILDHKDDKIIKTLTELYTRYCSLTTLICGWVDCNGENDYEAELKLVKIK